MKNRVLLIALAILLALGVGLVGCANEEVPEVTEHTLTISSTEGGKVTDPGEGTFSYDEVTVISLVAEPDEGYQFVSWTGNVSTIDNVNAAITSITVDMDSSIHAVFVLIPDISGTWCLYMTPLEGDEYRPDCVYLDQSAAHVSTFIWQHDYGVDATGNLTRGVLSLSGSGVYYGDTVSFSASASVDGSAIVGTYAFSGFRNETGVLRIERCQCRNALAWVRQLYMAHRGYALNFYLWDLIHEGIAITSVNVTGPHMDMVSLDSWGPAEVDYWFHFGELLPEEVRPSTGDIYQSSIEYSDGSFEVATASVRDIFVDLPTPISPTDGQTVETLTPTFSWQPSPCGCQGYYRIWIVNSDGDDIWSVYVPKETTSVIYDFDGQGEALQSGQTYEWRLIAFDEPISGGPDNNVWVFSTFTVQ